MQKLKLLAALCGLAGAMQAGSIHLQPLNGLVSGAPGQTTGWGFAVTNESPVEWISFVASFPINQTNPGLGTYVDFIGPQGGPLQFALNPGGAWSQTFDWSNGKGLGAFLIDSLATAGTTNSGDIRVVWESFAGDPSTCNCIPAQFSQDLPFEVGVVNTPEPGTLWMVGGGLLLFGLRHLRWAQRIVQRGLMLMITCSIPMMAQFVPVEMWQDGNGFCGAPGLRLCSNLRCAPLSGATLRIDPFTAQSLCDLTPPSCTAFATTPGKPLDLTFLVATDLHLRGGWDISDIDHVKHVEAMNMLPSLGYKWSEAGGGLDATAIARPQVVVTTGDDTHYGHQSELGAFRLLYEQGRLTESLVYPLLPGSGNHDMHGECQSGNCGRRMFSYIGTAPSCATNMDPVSHNYSWDWGQYHMVQLNVWAGDTSMGTDTAFGVNYGHASGLPWLQQDLATRVGNSGRPVILFQHYGWDPFSRNGDFWTPSDRAALLAVLKDYNVVGFFTGHQHKTGMYQTDPVDETGKVFDVFTGGDGGIDGTGDFFAVRLTEKYLDVVPFKWERDVNEYKPQMAAIGRDAAFPGGPIYFPKLINNKDIGCRKPVTAPPAPIPLTISVTNNVVTIQNTTGAPILGPLALRIKVKSLDSMSNVIFSESCAVGPVYSQLSITSLAPNQQVSFPMPLNGDGHSYFAADLAVVGIGADSLLAGPSTITVTPGFKTSVDVTTGLGRSVPFTFVVSDPWLSVTASAATTPTTLNLVVNEAATTFTRTASIVLRSSGYPDVKVTVNLGTVTMTVNSNLGSPIEVDGAAYATPRQFSWYPGETHQLRAANQTLATGSVDRFTSWSDGGAADHAIKTPVLGGSITANYTRFHRLTTVASPAGAGQITVTPASSDGYYATNTLLHFSSKPAQGYGFQYYGGIIPTSTVAEYDWLLTTPLTLTANFTPLDRYQVSTSLGALGSVTVDGVVYAGSATVQWAQGTQHTLAVPVSVSTGRNARDVFVRWSDGFLSAGRTVTTTGAFTSYLALYQRQYLVTVNMTPSSAGYLDGAGWYDDGATATVRASATPGYQFAAYSGDATGQDPVISILVNRPLTLNASFKTLLPVLTATPGPRDTRNPAASLVTFVLTNTGVGLAALTQIDSITAQTVAGSGTVTVGKLPLVYGSISPGQSTPQSMTLTWPATATRVAFTVQFSANGGAYKGQSTFYVIR